MSAVYKSEYRIGQLVKFTDQEKVAEKYGIIVAVTFFSETEVAYDIKLLNTDEQAIRVPQSYIVKPYLDTSKETR